MLAAKIAASTGISSARSGRKAGLDSACAIASKYSEQSQRQHDGRDNDRPFDEDVIAPVLWERRIRLLHRAISQVVPSLESLMTTPIAASSSRMRSDSLKSFRARAAVRSEISRSTRLASMPLACCLRCFHSATVSERNPRRRNEAANSVRFGSLSDAAFLKPCSEVIICAVLRSSDNASITA